MFHAIRQWIRALAQPSAMNREMSEEMQLHLARATERLMERGLSRADAEAAARREFGNVSVLSEEGRDARGGRWLETLRADVRYGLRSLRGSPAFTIVAVLSLAIGIGANTAIFSLINAVMLRALPVADPSQLVQLTARDTAPLKPGSIGETWFTNPQWEAIRDRAGDVASYAVSGTTDFNLADGGETRRANASWVNGDFFNALGVRPVAGRLIQPADDFRGCPATVAVSEGFWQSELGGAPDAIGRTIPLNGHRFTVVGVVPAEFFGIDVGRANQLYVPLCSEAIINGKGSALDRRSSWWIRVIARPKPGVTAERMGAKLLTVSREVFVATTPERYDAARQSEYQTQRIFTAPAATGLSDVRAKYSRALIVLMGMVGLLLLISCANVANLLLARGTARSREIAIRVAIGASRARVVRQFVTESLLLAVAGTALGGAIAIWLSRFLVGLLYSDDRRVALDLSLDPTVLGFAVAVCLATLAIFGIAPALRATRVDPQTAMKSGGRGTAEGQNRFGFGKSLVVAQSALALILVVGAGLLVTTFRQLVTNEKGFDASGVLLAKVDLERTSIPADQWAGTIDRLRKSFLTLPGVAHVSTTDITPVSGNSWNELIVVEGVPPGPKMDDRLSWFNQVDPDYFATMQTRMLSGRDFGDVDTRTSQKVAIVNEAMVRHFFHGQSPLGHAYYTEDMGHRGDRTTIIGVVADSKYRALREEAVPIVYLPFSQGGEGRSYAQFVIRAKGPMAATISGVKATSLAVDNRMSLQFTMLESQIASSMQRERLLAMLSGFFGALALLLAMIGLYGLMAYTVARRRAEIGIRVALGAARGRIIRLVLGDVGRLVGIGIAIGAAVAWYSTTVLGKLLYGVEPRDVTTLVAAVIVLGAAGLVAGFIPARRAASLDALEALREE